MSQISPPIRILLVCAVAFLAAWMLFLRPKDEAVAPATVTPTPATTPPVAAGGADADSLAGKTVEKANDTTAAQDARAEELAGATGTTTTGTADDPSIVAATPPEEAPATPEPGKLTDEVAEAGGLPERVLRALDDKQVVVLLFWSSKAPDDRSVRGSVRNINRHRGKVLTHVTHVGNIAAYGQITRAANVEQSPTIVVVDRDRKVETLVGYVDRVTIDQAVTDALRNS